MSNKNTEWKRISLTKEQVDFSGAVHSQLECDGDNFIQLTFKLKCGRVLRIRKGDYSVAIEAPVIPMQTKYIAKTNTGLTTTFDSRDAAEKAIEGLDGEIQEINVPLNLRLTANSDDLPF